MTIGSVYWSEDQTSSDFIYGDWTSTGATNYTSPGGSGVNIKSNKGVNPVLVFKLWKKNLTTMGKYRYNKRINKLEKLANQYINDGHNALATKFLNKLCEEIRLSEIYGAGVKMYLSKSLVDQYKYKIRDGHIADTLFDKYTNTIPQNILKKKQELDDKKVFDDFVIYHYWNEELEKKKEKKEPRSSAEKEAMKDPILFGICKDVPDKLFFIDEWDDEYCDLTFDELVDALPVEDKTIEISKIPEL